MPDPFVTFPGLPGSNASRGDVNILDADTAHLVQSKGQWGDTNQGVGIWSDSYPGHIGDSSIRVTASGAGYASQNYLIPKPLIPASEGDTLTHTIFVDNVSVVSPTLIVGLAFYNDEEQLAGNYEETHDWPAQGGSVSVTGTALAGATGAGISVHAPVAGAGEEYYLRGSCVSEGTDPTFVPSLRIVGPEIDVRAKCTRPSNAAVYSICGRLPDTANRVFWFDIGSGYLYFSTSPDGSASITDISNALLPGSEGDVQEVRVNRTNNDGAGNRRTSFYVDGVILGTEVVTPAVTTMFNTDGPFEVGSLLLGTSQNYGGDIYWVEVRDGIDGPVVTSFYPTDLVTV